jgi:hypothetical protein
MRRPVLDYWTDPALEVDDDDQEPMPWPAEVLVISRGWVTWTLIDNDD